MHIYIYILYIHCIRICIFCIFKNRWWWCCVCLGVLSWDPPTWSISKHAEIHVLVKLYINLDLIAFFAMTWNQATRSSRLRLRYRQVETPKNPGWIAPSYRPNHRKQTVILHGSSPGICQQFHIDVWWNLDRFRCSMSCGFVFSHASWTLDFCG